MRILKLRDTVNIPACLMSSKRKWTGGVCSRSPGFFVSRSVRIYRFCDIACVMIGPAVDLITDTGYGGLPLFTVVLMKGRSENALKVFQKTLDKLTALAYNAVES